MSENPGQQRLAEFTIKAIACGLIFGVLFGAANAYLGLRAGLTVSTSIPIAVLSVAVFRAFGAKTGTILEANMAQTIGSASSSLASGTIFTIPALFAWGFSPPIWQVAMLACFGGFLGILAMVPLRRLLIVQADAELPYPEGRACAEVLRASEQGAAGGSWIFAGLAIGAAVKTVITGFHLLPDDIATRVAGLPGATLSIAVGPAFLAVGFIIGFRASSVMVAGSLISALVFYPLITRVRGAATPITPGEIYGGYVRYLGAGAIAAAALVTIVKSAPTMAKSFAAVVSGLRRGGAAAGADRTDRDLPGSVLLIGLVALIAALALVPGLFAGNLPLGGRVAAALGVTVFGLLFVPVSSRLVGVIGVSSNPTSAMALVTLAATATVFSMLNWGGAEAKAAVLTVGTVVCVAASKAGDISQDLKTGWLVGATPARQQFGQLIAAAVACWAVAAVVVTLGERGDLAEGGKFAAPQAKLMKTIIEAVLGEKLPWDLLMMGGATSLVAILVGLPGLSFALGIYLPLATMAAIFFGGVVRRLAESGGQKKYVERGVLCASGFVAGEGLAGVFIAGYAYFTDRGRENLPPPTAAASWAGVAVLLACGFVLYRSTRAISGSRPEAT